MHRAREKKEKREKGITQRPPETDRNRADREKGEDRGGEGGRRYTHQCGGTRGIWTHAGGAKGARARRRKKTIASGIRRGARRNHPQECKNHTSAGTHVERADPKSTRMTAAATILAHRCHRRLVRRSPGALPTRDQETSSPARPARGATRTAAVVMPSRRRPLPPATSSVSGTRRPCVAAAPCG